MCEQHGEGRKQKAETGLTYLVEHNTGNEEVLGIAAWTFEQT